MLRVCKINYTCIITIICTLPLLQIFSVMLAISGITLFAYSDGFGSASLLGVSLAVLSAMGAALYKVCVGTG